MIYKATYADGGYDNNSSTLAGALRCIANRYGVDAGSLVTNDDGSRTLVWLTEDDAANDDGAHAVAEIKKN